MSNPLISNYLFYSLFLNFSCLKAEILKEINESVVCGVCLTKIFGAHKMDLWKIVL